MVSGNATKQIRRDPFDQGPALSCRRRRREIDRGGSQDMGRVANGNCFRPVRREHTEQIATPDTQIAQHLRILKNQSE